MKHKFSSKPKLTFNQIAQVIFTLEQVLKITFQVKPKILIAILSINSFLGILGVVSFYIEKLILDRLVGAIGAPDITPAFIAVLGFIIIALCVSLIRNIIVPLSNVLTNILTRYFDIQLDVLIGQKMAHLDMETIEDPVFRDKLDKVQRESGRRAGQLITPLSELPEAVFSFLSASFVLFAVSPFIPLAAVLLSLPRIWVNQKHIRIRFKFQSDTSFANRIWRWVRNYLVQNRNFMELKILNISDFLVSKLKGVAFKIVDAHYALNKTQVTERSWTYIPILLLEITTGGALVYWVLIQRITIGSFQLYSRSLRSVTDSWNRIAVSFTSIYENYLYVTDLVWLLNLQPKISENKGRKITILRTNISARDVWFRYREDTYWVAKGMSFEIKAGEKIAIVGENGAGKTTLIKLISRFYDPQKGGLYVNNYNLKHLAPEFWRKNLAVLFQQFEQYPFSARESIGYGNIGKINNNNKIQAVAKKVGIHEFIESLPLKYDNPLAPELPKGVHPSTGQWQRIGIARMLFREKAKVIILDEPTSNIDPEAEENIFNELAKLTKDKILIFVTQRFSTVRIADRIFVMDKGRIIEQGTHGELVNLNGKYARLYNLQAKAYGMGTSA